MDFTNIIIAGGSVCSLLYKKIVKDTSDIDIFIYGLNKKEFALKIYNIFNELINYKNSKKHKIYYTENAITINCDTIGIPIQIILYKFNDINDILYSFDLSLSSICFDGNNVLFNEISFISYRINCNIFHLKCVGVKTEKRIDKYFNCKNFGLLIPNFDIIKYINTTLYEDVKINLTENIKLSNLKLYENIFTGDLEYIKNNDECVDNKLKFYYKNFIINSDLYNTKESYIKALIKFIDDPNMNNDDIFVLNKFRFCNFIDTNIIMNNDELFLVYNTKSICEFYDSYLSRNVKTLTYHEINQNFSKYVINSPLFISFCKDYTSKFNLENLINLQVNYINETIFQSDLINETHFKSTNIDYDNLNLHDKYYVKYNSFNNLFIGGYLGKKIIKYYINNHIKIRKKYEIEIINIIANIFEDMCYFETIENSLLNKNINIENKYYFPKKFSKYYNNYILKYHNDEYFKNIINCSL